MSQLLPVAPSDRRRLWVAVLASGAFLVAGLVGGALRPGYDAWHQSISALSLGPGGWMQDGLFLFLGCALVSTVPVWRRILTNGIGARGYPILTALTGSSLIAAAFIPQDPAPGYDPEQLGYLLPTTTGLIHLAVAGIGAAASCGGLLLMASRFSALPGWRGWAAYSRASAVLTIACVIVYAVWSIQPTGLAGSFERLVVIVPGIWGGALVARLSTGVPFIQAGPPKSG